MLLTGEKPIPLGQLGAHDDFAKFETERVSGVNLGGENWRLDAIEDAVRNVALLFGLSTAVQRSPSLKLPSVTSVAIVGTIWSSPSFTKQLRAASSKATSSSSTWYMRCLKSRKT